MTTAPHSGSGLCRPSAQLSIRPVRVVIELGAVADVLHAALNAAHHANRQGEPDDRLAVALPRLHLVRGVARPGHEVVLFGSEVALGRYIGLEGVRTLARRGMVAPLDIVGVWSERGEPGTAYVRDRSVMRRSVGAIRRARVRAERRGKTIPDRIDAHEPDLAVLALHYGSAVVHIREVEAEVTSEPLQVSTYGFSSTRAPAVLPIRADRTPRWVEDAA